MARGPKKHMKRLATPQHWMLDKLGGVYAVRPRSGPHKIRECLPLSMIIKNRLGYATNYREVQMIVKQKLVKVDGRVRADHKFPAGFMDVITIDKTGDKFRLMYDTKGRFVLNKIPQSETGFKVCRVQNKHVSANRTPALTLNDGRCVAFPDPLIQQSDSVVVDLATGKVRDWVRFKPGALAMISGGANTGRVGVIKDVEKHLGAFDIVHVEDAIGNTFATRSKNVFVIGKDADSPLVSLPKAKGIRATLVADRKERIAATSRN